MKNLDQISQSIQSSFQDTQQVLSFDTFLKRIAESPQGHLRGSAQYALDAIEHFGKDESNQFKIFSAPEDPHATRVIGQSQVQNEIYNSLKSFARQGYNNRLLLLHGPNGSAKSTLVSALMKGLEAYSSTADGAVYTFSWIFPIDRIARGGLGIGRQAEKTAEKHDSYANLPEEDIACIIPSELCDHPILLVPRKEREIFLSTLDLNAKTMQKIPLRLRSGGLSHRDHLIFQALLTNYQGDFSQVIRHIRVERFYFSKVYRRGLISIEPQMHVDAQYQQLTMNRSLSQLPNSLQGLNLFSITGDLASANRGVIDFNDLLKRPLESYKYLLSACESGKVNIGQAIIDLDTLFIGSSNELQLDAFKEYPDFSSFKGRIELIRVPYLLKLSEEMKIYEQIITDLSVGKPVTPHTIWSIAFWGVLSRLKKPHRDRYSGDLAAIVDRITPLDKLHIYDTGTLPERFTNDERKLLKANLKKLSQEFDSVPFYEGRMGASARELISILIDAAQNPNYKTLSPLAVVEEIKNFIQRTSEHEFLRQESVDGYHNHEAFIEILLNEYATIVDREVRDCLGLYDTTQWLSFTKKYIQHLSAFLKKEKIKNSITGGYDQPDASLMSEFESIAGAPSDPSQKEQFRQNIIAQIGAWSLDHPNEPMDYFKVFPEIRQRIEKHFYESQKALLKKMHTALSQFGSEHDDSHSEGSELARQTIENMQSKFGYSMAGAKEVINFLMSKKY